MYADGWYDYLYLIIDGAKSIVRDLISGVNYIVYCSDGRDRAEKLCALSYPRGNATGMRRVREEIM